MRRRGLSLLALVFAVLGFTPALGFDPDEDGHLFITRQALQSISRVVNGQEVRFSERAIGYIMEVNRVQDHSQYFFSSKRHFDGGQFCRFQKPTKVLLRITARSKKIRVGSCVGAGVKCAVWVEVPDFSKLAIDSRPRPG